ncbi:MAG TPA: hypothetical protein VH370_03125 [Humisphaera sp.]|jgi:hypothetical protein|nr:hypothetical protein [Humisphaera sp.]
MMRGIIAVVTGIGLVAAGCQVDTHLTNVAELSAKQMTVRSAPWRGDFRLYSIPPNTKEPLDQVTKPIMIVHLNKGERVGFLRRPDGANVAVAGAQEILVSPGQYTWVMQADAGQTDPVKTTILVVLIVVVVALGVALIVVAVDVGHAVHDIHVSPVGF